MISSSEKEQYNMDDGGEEQKPNTNFPMKALIFRIILPIFFIAIAGVGYKFLSKKPEPTPFKPPAKKSLEVMVEELVKRDYQIVFETQGSIQSHSQINLTSQVVGTIQTITPGFEAGAFFKKGDLLIELDPLDFEVQIYSANRQLAQAQLAYAQEVTRANQAKLNWKDLGYEGEPNELVLRTPHLKQTQKSVELAEAQLRSAERNLSRSKVRAPFDGRVVSRSVGIGQAIGGSTPLGVIFPTDYSEVRLPVSTRSLANLTLPEDESDPPVEIKLRDALNEDNKTEWTAKIVRTEGSLDASTLELFAIARVEDPFGIQSNNQPLRIGQPVIAFIPGTLLKDVYVIPRDDISGLNRIRVADPETLTLGSLSITPVWSDEENVIIKNPYLAEGTLLVKTRLVYAPDGALVEVIDPQKEIDGLTSVKPAPTNAVNKPFFGIKAGKLKPVEGSKTNATAQIKSKKQSKKE